MMHLHTARLLSRRLASPACKRQKCLLHACSINDDSRVCTIMATISVEYLGLWFPAKGRNDNAEMTVYTVHF